MRRLKLNKQMMRRIEAALDERKNERRGPPQSLEFPGERRACGPGRRQTDRAAPRPGQDCATSGQPES
jgi:hypothetical protein